MPVLVDPPQWPAHGTLWSHLVSDTSLAELHEFAAAADLPARGFERDHYDVPADRHAGLVALGARPVGARDLVRRLRASGLRRSELDETHHDAQLLDRWRTLRAATTPPYPDATGARAATPVSVGHPPEAWDAVGQELLERWHERGRLHHDASHLREVLDAVDRLAHAEALDRSTHRRALLAAWFHDAVHASGRRRTQPEAPGSDEEESARLAVVLLAEDPDAAAVAALVRMTTHHRPDPGDRAAAVLSDADLAVLGTSPARYADYAAAIRMEYGHVPAEVFRPARARILGDFLAGPLFHTASGRARWEDAARANLTAEIAALTGRAPRPR